MIFSARLDVNIHINQVLTVALLTIYDMCAVADAEPQAIELAAPFLGKHGAAFLQRLQERAEFLEAEFNAIDVLGFRRPFAQCLEQARSIIGPILAQTGH